LWRRNEFEFELRRRNDVAFERCGEGTNLHSSVVAKERICIRALWRRKGIFIRASW
jgi:hypothetical protein